MAENEKIEKIDPELERMATLIKYSGMKEFIEKFSKTIADIAASKSTKIEVDGKKHEAKWGALLTLKILEGYETQIKELEAELEAADEQ